MPLGVDDDDSIVRRGAAKRPNEERHHGEPRQLDKTDSYPPKR